MKKKLENGNTIVVDLMHPRCVDCDSKLQLKALDVDGNAIKQSEHDISYKLTRDQQVVEIRTLIVAFEEGLAQDATTVDNPFVSMFQSLGFTEMP